MTFSKKDYNLELKGIFEFSQNALFYFPVEDEIGFLANNKIKVSSSFSLDAYHNLVCYVERSLNGVFGESINLNTKIVDAGKNSLEFLLLDRQTPTFKKIRRIQLKGVWQVDSVNRLIFSCRSDIKKNELLFKNTWIINKKNNIEYIYRLRPTGQSKFNFFVLRGRWSYKQGYLTYYVEGSNRRKLSFQVKLTKIFVLKNKNKLQFTLAVSEDGAAKKSRVVSLNGSWRRSGNGVDFFVSAGDGLKEIKFSFKKKISDDKEVTFSLVNRQARNLGYEITFSKKLLNDGDYFLKAAFGDEKRIEGGFNLPF
ncbi:MAG: hypothetical protein PHV17_03930 [Candidatus Omnitrophica bacterium]|nr:hypothetical protein [Candidatus Omnitrophota bacterium]